MKETQKTAHMNKPIQDGNWIDEYHNGVRYGLEAKLLIEEQSKFQKITVIESTRYGKGLLLDGCWMTAEKQEKHYHECLVQPAMCSAKEIKKVLIIGGGDGGTAKECLLHKEVAQLDLVEIDEKVVEICKKQLPTIGGQAWQDPRLKVKIEDGVHWIANASSNYYDVIFVDGSDPAGPAKGLFNKVLFENCRRGLRRGGIFATQSESPEAFREIHIDTVKILREVFEYADPLYGWVPMYPSGWWSWTFAAIDNPRYLTPIKQRVIQIEENCEIWSPRWQNGAFEAMPAFVERGLSK